MKFGTIGTGMIVQRVIEGILDAPGSECIAVYSRTEEKGRKLADEYGVKKVYTDLDAMFSDPEIDWIYVASPNSLHYGHTMAALRAGKNVLCEKPFASNARQAQEMADLAREKGLLLYEALTTTFLKNYAVMQEMMKKIGRLRLITGGYSQYSSRYDQLKQGIVTNAFDPNFSGGCLMDINYYNVAFCVSLFGEPEKASYAANFYGNIDTSGIAVLEYPDFVCQCTGAKDTWGDNTVQLQGEDGYIVIYGGSNGITGLRLVTREGEEVVPEGAPFARWREELYELDRIVSSGDRADCDRRMEITLATMRTIDRLRVSAGLRFPADNE